MYSGVWFNVVFLAMMCHSLSLSPVPPLTRENVLKEVEGVNKANLYVLLNPPGDVVEFDISTDEVVEDFLQGRCHYQPSWRALIFSLDDGGKADYANRIRPYAEPVQGRYMLCD